MSKIDQWRWRGDAIHINGGREFFAYMHRCIDEPRLSVMDKYFKKTRTTKRTFVVDGVTHYETEDEAIAALDIPPIVTDQDRALLAELSEIPAVIEQRGRFLELEMRGLIAWGRDTEGHVTIALTPSGKAALAGSPLHTPNP